MVNDPGDKVYGDGDSITVTNSTSNDIPQGAQLTFTGDHEVAPVDASGAGDRVDAVAFYPIPADGTGVAQANGVVEALVTSAVEGGDEIGAPDSGTGGTPGVGNETGGTGNVALGDAREFLSSGDYYAPVKLD